MRYETRHDFEGNAEAALKAVEAMLIPHGFRLVDSGPGRNRYEGRGMNNSRENPLRGATQIEVAAQTRVMHLHADLGGVRRMALFVCVFPLVLWAGLTLAPMIAHGGDRMEIGTAGMLGTAVWMVVGPVIAWVIRRRTLQALDDLLAGAAAVAARESA